MDLLQNILPSATANLPNIGEKNNTIDEHGLVLRHVAKYNAEHKDSEIKCELCNGKGMVAFDRMNELYGNWEMAIRRCSCYPKREKLRRMKRSGLENIIKDFTWESYKTETPWQQKIKATAQDYSEHDAEGWFYIGGQSGAGKSHICTAICRDMFRQNKEVKYMSWREEARKLKASINDEYYDDTVAHLKTVDVLYIDDLFKSGGEPTAAEISLAFEILNERYLKKLSTIISSEKTLTDILTIDEAIAGRIKERAGTHVLNIRPDHSKNYRFAHMGEEL